MIELLCFTAFGIAIIFVLYVVSMAYIADVIKRLNR